MGVGNPAPVGGKRGRIVGWSAAAVRRHKRWLYSVEAPHLDGDGDAVTLTLRVCPESAAAWSGLLRVFFQALRREGVTRFHWVVEWQRRGAPHLHLAVYGPEGSDPGLLAVREWLRLAGPAYGASRGAQHVTPITGAVGWLKYLSKHASRGVAHYQRQGKPAGWETTGRLWGYGGDWPIAEALEGVIGQREMWRTRRMVQGYLVAAATVAALGYAGDPKKSAAAWKSVAWLRRMRKCPDRALSTVRGVSEWVPGPLFVRMAVGAGWDGVLAD